jgi:hypothetical protein
MRAALTIVAVWLVSVTTGWAQNCVISGSTNYGSITQNCIVVGPTRLTFQTAIAEELVRRLPKEKPVVIRSVGSDRDQTIASQYQQFLVDHGYTIKARAGIGVLAPPPDYPITIDDRADSIFVTIDPSVR